MSGRFAHRARAAALTVAVLAGGCANLGEGQLAGRVGAQARCVETLGVIDQAVREGGVADAMATRVDGFPYLRSNRFLASFAREPMTDAQFDQWLGLMAALDREARRIELFNLSADRAQMLDREIRTRTGTSPLEAIGCAESLRAADSGNPRTRTLVRERAHVPDDYATWQRVVGMYPLTRLPLVAGVARYQREEQRLFDLPLRELHAEMAITRYRPSDLSPSDRRGQPDARARPLADASRNPLGIPLPDAAEMLSLARAHAPLFEVADAGPADRIGIPYLDASGVPQLDASRPTVFFRTAHTRYRGRNLLQLVYSIWFSERPAESALDLLSGRLDGIIWRVTLAPDGTPLLYDTIHNCGCYQMFFPTPGVEPLPPEDSLDEQAFVPQRLPAHSSGSNIIVRIASGSHYVQRVLVAAGAVDAPSRRYEFREDDALRSYPLARAMEAVRGIADPLPAGALPRLFDAEGLVPGTERLERMLFWPMGIASAGAMRQWGRHATAFVGRRHFDDARLFERYFHIPSVEQPAAN